MAIRNSEESGEESIRNSEESGEESIRNSVENSPRITGNCGKTSSQEGPGPIFSTAEDLANPSSKRKRQSEAGLGNLLPNLLVEGDPKVR